MSKSTSSQRERCAATTRKLAGPARTHLDALGVHLVPLVRGGPVEAGVALLVDEEVGEVDLLELELDRLDELGGDKLGRLGAELHGRLEVLAAELDHDRVGVAVDDRGVGRVAVGGVELALDLVLGALDHLPAEGGGGHGDG